MVCVVIVRGRVIVLFNKNIFTTTISTTELHTEWQTDLNRDGDARFRGDPLPSETTRVRLIRHDDRLHYGHRIMFSIVPIASQRNERAFREAR